jgi:alpha-tubulin suppressor-like RCC1 family protein
MIAFVIVVLLHFVRHLQAAGFLYALDSTRANVETAFPTFIPVTVSGFERIVAIAAGYQHDLLLDNNGMVIACGR